MPATVFDSSALLALFFEEDGADQVEEILHNAAVADRPVMISAVNWAEVLYRMERKRGEEGVTVAKRFETTMPLDVIEVGRELAEEAAKLKAEKDLGLADAFAAALAKQKRAELVATDNEFRVVEKELKKIRWLK